MFIMARGTAVKASGQESIISKGVRHSEIENSVMTAFGRPGLGWQDGADVRRGVKGEYVVLQMRDHHLAEDVDGAEEDDDGHDCEIVPPGGACVVGGRSRG